MAPPFPSAPFRRMVFEAGRAGAVKAHQVLHSHEDSNPGDPGAAPEADDSGNPEASNKPEILVKPEFVRPDETANSDAALEPADKKSTPPFTEEQKHDPPPPKVKK